jgi:hypothetical protein
MPALISEASSALARASEKLWFALRAPMLSV